MIAKIFDSPIVVGGFGSVDGSPQILFKAVFMSWMTCPFNGYCGKVTVIFLSAAPIRVASDPSKFGRVTE